MMKRTKLNYSNWNFYRTQCEDPAAQSAMQGQREVYMQAIDKTMNKLRDAFDDPRHCASADTGLCFVRGGSWRARKW